MEFNVIREHTTSQGNRILLMELLSGVVPTTTTQPPVNPRVRNVDLTLNAILETLNIAENRFRYISQAQWSGHNHQPQVSHNGPKNIYTPRFPIWVYDTKLTKIRCLALAPYGIDSIHVFAGGAYGYPRCCIDAYVSRDIKKQTLSRAESKVFNERFQSMLAQAGYLELFRRSRFEPCQRCVGSVSCVEMESMIKTNALVNKSMIDNNEGWLLFMYLYVSDKYRWYIGHNRRPQIA